MRYRAAKVRGADQPQLARRAYVRAPRRVVVWFGLAALVILVAACGDKVTVTAPSAPFELFRGVQQFLAISSLLISESREFWGQGLRNAYYAALTLARYKSNTYYATPTEQFHQLVWAQAPKKARKYFRDELRRLRTKYDYDLMWPADESPAEDLRDFAERGPAAFESLLVDAEQIIARRYQLCAELGDKPRQQCQECGRNGCARALLLGEVGIVRVKVGELFDRAVAKALAAAANDQSPSSPDTPSA